MGSVMISNFTEMVRTVAWGIGVKDPHTVEESIAVSEMIRAIGIIRNIFTPLTEV